MFQRIRFFIYNWLKPWMDAVGIEFKNELVRQQNRKNAKIADELQEKFHATLTDEKIAALRARPPIGGCSHRKGIGPYTNPDDEMSGGANRFRIKDYNVGFHTYPDCTQSIRCMRCNEVAWNRHGEKTPNWDAFLELTHQTTNTATQSEITPEMLSKYGRFLEGPAAQWDWSKKVVYLDKLE
jgi:hypothetical protein